MQQTVQSHGVFRFLIWFRGCSRCCDAYVGDHVCPRLRRKQKKKIVPSQSSAAQSVGSEQELWRVIKEERLKHFPSRKTIDLISAAWLDRGARLETLGLLALQERMV